MESLLLYRLTSHLYFKIKNDKNKLVRLSRIIIIEREEKKTFQNTAEKKAGAGVFQWSGFFSKAAASSRLPRIGTGFNSTRDGELIIDTSSTNGASRKTSRRVDDLQSLRYK